MIGLETRQFMIVYYKELHFNNQAHPTCPLEGSANPRSADPSNGGQFSDDRPISDCGKLNDAASRVLH